MHGRFRREGEGSCKSSQRSISWHMHPIVVATDSNSSFKGEYRVTMESGLYNILLHHFPMEFLLKLLSTVVLSSSELIKNAAVTILCSHISVLDDSYATLDFDTSHAFQSQVLFLLKSESHSAETRRCSVQCASKILSLELSLGLTWTELIEFSSDSLTSGNWPAIDVLFDIYCAQDVYKQREFISELEPYFRIEIFMVLLLLIDKGDDYRAFLPLPSICSMVRPEQ